MMFIANDHISADSSRHQTISKIDETANSQAVISTTDQEHRVRYNFRPTISRDDHCDLAKDIEDVRDFLFEVYVFLSN